MSPEEKNISSEAISYIKAHKKELIGRFANLKDHPPAKIPLTIFMAGSPGAGKTEFSRALVDTFNQNYSVPVVRIDADEIRDTLSECGYTGNNSHIFTDACSKGVHFLFDSCIKYNQHLLLDTTLASIITAEKNIERALEHSRQVSIFYLYQDPLIAWEFTKKREAIEGRRVSKEFFIDSFLAAKENANIIKRTFGKQVQLYLVEKDYSNNLGKYTENIDNIDSYIKTGYNREELIKKLNEYDNLS